MCFFFTIQDSFGLFGDLFGRISWGTVLVGKGVGQLVGLQGWSPLNTSVVYANMQNVKQKWQEASRDEHEIVDGAQTRNKSIRKVEMGVACKN